MKSKTHKAFWSLGKSHALRKMTEFEGNIYIICKQTAAL